jgi:hypothetical protein
MCSKLSSIVGAWKRFVYFRYRGVYHRCLHVAYMHSVLLCMTSGMVVFNVCMIWDIAWDGMGYGGCKQWERLKFIGRRSVRWLRWLNGNVGV